MRNAAITAVVLVIVGFGGFVLLGGGTKTTTAQTYTGAEVDTHFSAADCWTIIDDGVYDISSYVPRHPGGDEILRACGGDGTTLFESRQTEDGEQVGSGTPHSGSATNLLNGFLIGELAD